jgi:hypothetical protein
MALDTVANAITHPETIQPFRELGLKDDEYDRIKAILGRRIRSCGRSIVLINHQRFI